jgi:Co/Zn/Cd efflux system component/copper chaperone CopZ
MDNTTKTSSENLVTTLAVPKMDCPSEEQMIRMALEGKDRIQNISVDLAARTVKVIHSGKKEDILAYVLPLKLGAYVLNSQQSATSDLPIKENVNEHKVLKTLLTINALMFCIEMIVGWFAQSAGLITDSLDMFADAIVYGISLYAVGKSIEQKHRAARMSGYLQILLATGAFFEVGRRFLVGYEPIGSLMMAISFIALIANVSCMVLLYKHRTGEVHMRASWIFSTNDVIANVGVIVAGIFVAFTGSNIPDLIIGLMIAGVVLSGALRILRVAK